MKLEKFNKTCVRFILTKVLYLTQYESYIYGFQYDHSYTCPHIQMWYVTLGKNFNKKLSALKFVSPEQNLILLGILKY